MSDIFYFKEFTVKQSNKVFKITTDSIILGAYASFREPKLLLDIGTGTGVLALILAQKYRDAQIYALDIMKEAVNLAKENFLNSRWFSRLQVIEADIWKFVFFGKKFDGIVSNPPFYLSSKRSENKVNIIARHDEKLTYAKLAFSVKRLLSKGGSFYVIIPVESARILEREFNFEYLFCQKRLYICYEKGDSPIRVIFEFGHKIERCQEDELYIKEKGFYSRKYIDLVKKFYINF